MELWSEHVAPRKYHILMTLIVASLVSQPFVRDYLLGRIVHEATLLLAMASILVFFRKPSQRIFGMSIALIGGAANFARYLHPEAYEGLPLTIFLICTVAFLAFAIWVILKNLFQQKAVSSDHLIGVFCGYLLAGVAWGSMYALCEQLSPGSFETSNDLVWKMTDADSQRSLFNYFSFTTLTTLGFGDVSPKHPVACSLAWLEAGFGQFYVAVLVAQLVGLKLESRGSSDA